MLKKGDTVIIGKDILATVIRVYETVAGTKVAAQSGDVVYMRLDLKDCTLKEHK